MRKKILKHSFVGLVILLIAGYYFGVRLPNLTLQPIFADEAIYIRWAQVMRSEPTLRFVSLTDGKTPLFMWTMIPMFKLVPDPLIAGRLLAVFSGFGTLVGVLVLGWYFINRRVGLWSAFLVAAIPYMIFFDRMALVDSMLTAFGIWAVVLSLLMVKFQRLDLAMFLGFCLGGSMLTKTPGYFNVLMSPLALITFPWKKTSKLWTRIKILLLSMSAILIAMFVYNLLRLGPGFSSLSSRNNDYVHPLSRLWEIPFDPLISHFRDMAEWFPIWLGWLVIVLVVIGMARIVIKKDLIGMVVLGWAVVPLLVEAALLKTFTTRYILFSIPLLLVVAAYGIDWLAHKFSNVFVVIIVAIILTQSLWFVYLTQTDPANAPIPRESRRGYFEDWTSGYGLREVASILEQESRGKKILIGTGGTFGTLPDGLRIYFDKNPNAAFASGNDFYYKELLSNAGNVETYFVVNSDKLMPVPTGLELIKSFPKAEGSEPIKYETRLYKVLPVLIDENIN